MSSNWQPKAGYILACSYCGEQVGSGKYCKDCKTQDGRKQIFEANAKLIKERTAKGLPVPDGLKNWK